MKAHFEAMHLTAPAKINLSFEIVGKRPDGYHDIRTVMQTIDLCDHLYFAHADAFSLTGSLVCPDDANIIVQTVRVLERELKTGHFPVHIVLQKMIPLGSGMGGGSADAAATLLALNYMYRLQLSQETLTKIGVEIGSDVPFFIQGGKCLVEGRGEKVTPMPMDAPGTQYLVFRPHKRLTTAAAYLEYDLTGQTFEESARAKCPQLREIFEFFPDVHISGKGPTCWYKTTPGWLAPHKIMLNNLLRLWDGDIYLCGPIAPRKVGAN